MERQLIVLDDDVAAAGVAVAGLADAADVDHDLLLVEFEFAADFGRRIKAAVLGKHARHVGVALEAVLVDETKNPFDLPLVVNVFGKNVLV